MLQLAQSTPLPLSRFRFFLFHYLSIGCVAALSLAAPAIASGETLSCPDSSTLESLVECISRQMPQDGSGGFMPPGSVQQSDYQGVVKQMLAGQCDFALPTSLAANMAIRTFPDAANGRHYCVLMEVTSTATPGYVDKGWGTFITYANAVREVSHHAPHPKYSTQTTGTSGDAFTERTAIRIFKQTDSRSFLMAGSRRSANHVSSACQSKAWMSDVSHDTGNLFYPANQAMKSFYGTRDWTAIEWHGKAASSCTNDMFLSNGISALPPEGSKLARLHKEIRSVMPSWIVEVAGASSCTLTGATNISGRFLNGVEPSRVCSKSATSASGQFVHIEQTVGVIGKDIDGAAAAWAAAVKNVFNP